MNPQDTLQLESNSVIKKFTKNIIGGDVSYIFSLEGSATPNVFVVKLKEWQQYYLVIDFQHNVTERAQKQNEEVNVSGISTAEIERYSLMKRNSSLYRIEVLTPEHRRLHPFLEYKRVLTTPSCKLTKHADGSDGGKKVPAFSQYYVYDDDGTAYEVGTNTTGNVVGFLQKDCVLQWKLPLAMFFTNPANRYRALIFDEETSLDSIIDPPDGSGYYRAIYDQVLKQGHAEHVISIEPEEYVDYQKNFYLLPILNSVESMFPDGYYVYKHEIASITTAAGAGAQKLETTKDPSDPAIVDFKAAVVFVIDSSMSMQPYIDRLKQAINTIYKSIEEKNLSEKMHIGLIALSTSPRLVHGVDFNAKMVLIPGEATNSKQLNQALSLLKLDTVQRRSFSMDSYAGISMALNNINWEQYDGRSIVLITDSGAFYADDPQSSTGLDAKDLQLEAERKDVDIYVLHLLTEEGRFNHASARNQYEIMSFNSKLSKPLYYDVGGNTGDVQRFGSMVDTLANSITSQVELAVRGELSAGSALAAEGDGSAAAASISTASNQEEVTPEDSKKLGLALQLPYLGRIKGNHHPDFIRGWISERDIVDHDKMVGIPVVLLNRNQLSDLCTLIKGLLESCIAGKLGSDPNLLSKSKDIGEMGVMGDILERLPYRSSIYNFTPYHWFYLESEEQASIIHDLENSLKYLQHCLNDNDHFIKLNAEADDSEAVYPVPLEVLP